VVTGSCRQNERAVRNRVWKVPGQCVEVCSHACGAAEAQWKVTACGRGAKSIGTHMFGYVAGELQRALRLSALISRVDGACSVDYARSGPTAAATVRGRKDLAVNCCYC
jgi:hypothetical protein